MAFDAYRGRIVKRIRALAVWCPADRRSDLFQGLFDDGSAGNGAGVRAVRICPEVTAKACRLGLSILEVPIRYHPRTVAEGKKIRLTDGWKLS